MKVLFLFTVLALYPTICFSDTVPLYVPDDYPTIQAAIDNFDPADHDMIVVKPGTYVENIDFNGNAIVLSSSEGAEYTCIDGNQSGPVVTFSSGEITSSVLDGFTITNGNNSLGGGIYCLFSSPMIINNIITDNSSGMYGGGIYCESSSAILFNNIISDNSSGHSGGGIKIKSSGTPVISNSIVVGNSAANNGGGFSIIDNPDLIILNVAIENNGAVYGGGIYCIDSSSKLLNCQLINNNADYGSGIYIGSSGTHLIENSLFHSNDAVMHGGGIALTETIVLTVTNCTLHENSAINGGGIYCTHINAAPVVENTILWDNTPTQLEGGNATVNYCDIQGGWTGTGGDNIDLNPTFTTGPNGDFYLSQVLAGQGTNSPCVDEGDPLSDFVPVTTRTDEFIDINEIDIGYHYSGDIYVPAYFPTIQEAIDFASDGSTIHVASGTYVENLDFHGKAVKVKSIHGPENTTIDGNQSGPVVTFCTYEKQDAELCGFTITNGTGTTYPRANNAGGGILCINASPTISNNLIRGNYVEYPGGWGGGICILDENSRPKIINNIISHNHGRHGGGILTQYLAAPEIINTIVCNNTASIMCGGIYCFRSSPTIVNSSIVENQNGGLFCRMESEPTVSNSIIWNNVLEIYTETGGNPTITYTNVKGSWPGTGNINSDPLFVDIINYDYHLTEFSPCKNTGDNTAILDLYDFEGDPRIAYLIVDMGADEYYVETTWYVDGTNTTGPWDGSQAHPFQYIQDGITEAEKGDAVHVMPYTYMENIDFLGKAIRVESDAGYQTTVIDGTSSGSVVLFVNNEYRDSILDGFTITNGSGSYYPGNMNAGGGDILCRLITYYQQQSHCWQLCGLPRRLGRRDLYFRRICIPV